MQFVTRVNFLFVIISHMMHYMEQKQIYTFTE